MPILDNLQTKVILSETIRDVFPNDRDVLLRVCMSEYREPHGFHHPLAIAELVGWDALNNQIIGDVQVGYVFITSFYYVQDAVVDRHEKDDGDKLYLPHLFALAHRTYLSACRKASPQKIEDFERLFFEYVSRNSAVVRDEMLYCSNPLSETENRRSVVERANSFLFLYPFLAMLFDRPFDRGVYETLCDFVFHLQSADNVIDWKSDYRSQRWTPFLRAVFRDRKKVLGENELEEAIFRNGYLEKSIAEVVDGLNEVETFFRIKTNVDGERLLAMVRNQIQKMKDFAFELSTHRSNVA